MAASVNSSSWSTPEVYKHHEQQKICISRPKYREGRRPKAVKVYTINLESRFLMVQGVPAIGVMTELVQLCALYGVVEEYRPLDEYPAEEFTEVYLIKFQKLTSARAAKRNMDEKSFFGGILHVCYAPEYEAVEDTRQKLQDRRRYVARTAQMKAKEREQKEEESEKTPPSHTPDTSHMPHTSQKIPRHEQRFSSGPQQGERSNTSQYCGFPLLPLPPRERSCSRNTPPWLASGPQGSQPWTVPTQGNQPWTVPTQGNQPWTGPTEDRMGTLHNAIDSEQQHLQPPSSSSSSSSGDRSREAVRRPTNDPRPAIRSHLFLMSNRQKRRPN
ncbi:RNA-binding protein 48 isoform X2 [Osmerus mordax]|uniref:RNA-binding protein 48 isoform X2 n=1 Tax=Osmerus mordax TaxID=8014 RepID=UPI00350FBCD4